MEYLVAYGLGYKVMEIEQEEMHKFEYTVMYPVDKLNDKVKSVVGDITDLMEVENENIEL